MSCTCGHKRELHLNRVDLDCVRCECSAYNASIDATRLGKKSKVATALLGVFALGAVPVPTAKGKRPWPEPQPPPEAPGTDDGTPGATA